MLFILVLFHEMFRFSAFHFRPNSILNPYHVHVCTINYFKIKRLHFRVTHNFSLKYYCLNNYFLCNKGGKDNIIIIFGGAFPFTFFFLNYKGLSYSNINIP